MIIDSDAGLINHIIVVIANKKISAQMNVKTTNLHLEKRIMPIFLNIGKAIVIVYMLKTTVVKL